MSEVTTQLSNTLIGEKLSSVTFVMDYLQLDFDGNQFTINIWPTITTEGNTFSFSNSDYRNRLCSLIGKKVSSLEYIEDEYLTINFGNQQTISISLDPNNPEIVTPELVVFTDSDQQCYVF